MEVLAPKHEEQTSRGPKKMTSHLTGRAKTTIRFSLIGSLIKSSFECVLPLAVGNCIKSSQWGHNLPVLLQSAVLFVRGNTRPFWALRLYSCFIMDHRYPITRKRQGLLWDTTRRSDFDGRGRLYTISRVIPLVRYGKT